MEQPAGRLLGTPLAFAPRGFARRNNPPGAEDSEKVYDAAFVALRVSVAACMPIRFSGWPMCLRWLRAMV
jgi:hypothetical protein